MIGILFSAGQWILGARVPLLFLLVALAGLGFDELRVEAIKHSLHEEQLAHAATKNTLLEERAGHANKLAASVQEARAEEQKVTAKVMEALNDANQKTRTLQLAVARLDAQSRGLRDDLSAVKLSADHVAQDSAASGECKAAAAAASMLADLYGRESERRRELAQYADETRIAAEQCVASYPVSAQQSTKDDKP